MTPLNNLGVICAGKFYNIWLSMCDEPHDLYDDTISTLPSISECQNKDIFVAIGSNAAREKFFEQFKDRNFKSFHGKMSDISKDAILGDGYYVSNFATIYANTKIGRGFILGTGSVIDVGAEIGDFVKISHQVFVGEKCKIGKGCVIHPGVKILPGVELGDNVYVVTGSVVTHSYGDNVTIAGAPARSVTGNNELHLRHERL